MRWFVVVLLVSGCDAVFRLDDLEPASDATASDSDVGIEIDAAIDAGLVGDRPWFCQAAQVFDDMSGPNPCVGWGVVIAGSLVNQHDGVLDIAVTSASTAAFYGCTAYGPYAALSDHGVFAKVDAVLAVPSAYTKLGVRNALNTTPVADANITYNGALAFFVNNVQIAVDSSQPPARWWRIRNPTGTELFVAELSNDGDTWTTWAMAQAAIPSQIAVDIGAGITVAPPPAGKATFSAFGICR